MKRLISTLLSLGMMTSLCFAEDAVYLDHVDGLHVSNPQAIIVDYPIVFYFNFRVETAKVNDTYNGNRVYSLDGATWEPVILGTSPMLASFMDVIIPSYSSVDGSGADTIGLCTFALFGSGIPVGYDGLATTLTTKVFPEDIGKTLCIDSSYFPSFVWTWGLSGGGALFTHRGVDHIVSK